MNKKTFAAHQSIPPRKHIQNFVMPIKSNSRKLSMYLTGTKNHYTLQNIATQCHFGTIKPRQQYHDKQRTGDIYRHRVRPYIRTGQHIWSKLQYKPTQVQLKHEQEKEAGQNKQERALKLVQQLDKRIRMNSTKIRSRSYYVIPRKNINIAQNYACQSRGLGNKSSKESDWICEKLIRDEVYNEDII